MLALLGATVAWTMPPPSLPKSNRARSLLGARSGSLHCCDALPDDVDAEAMEAAYKELEADDMECTGRVVTELVETGNSPLPDRFMFAMRAIRGDFSPDEGMVDTERVEDAITSALISFPATVSLRVVTRPLADGAFEELAEQLSLMLTTLEGAETAGVSTKERPGQRRSMEFSLRVPDANSLSMLREALKDDERIQMVF